MSNMPEASSALFIAQYSEDAIADAIQRVSKVIIYFCMKCFNFAHFEFESFLKQKNRFHSHLYKCENIRLVSAINKTHIRVQKTIKIWKLNDP